MPQGAILLCIDDVNRQRAVKLAITPEKRAECDTYAHGAFSITPLLHKLRRMNGNLVSAIYT